MFTPSGVRVERENVNDLQQLLFATLLSRDRKKGQKESGTRAVDSGKQCNDVLTEESPPSSNEYRRAFGPDDLGDDVLTDDESESEMAQTLPAHRVRRSSRLASQTNKSLAGQRTVRKGRGWVAGG
ncbi:hypothetical protein L208DRAFT_1405025 [Tricholoma matsutake]|nr:hypothetical protein L208DRAFT_1405025 [Tricholoma matsutake 945]